MSRGDACTRIAERAQYVTGENAARVKDDLALPVVRRESVRDRFDLRVGDAEPDDLGFERSFVQGSNGDARRSAQCASAGERSAVAADDFTYAIARGMQMPGQGAPEPSRADDSDRGMFHGARITEWVHVRA